MQSNMSWASMKIAFTVQKWDEYCARMNWINASKWKHYYTMDSVTLTKTTRYRWVLRSCGMSVSTMQTKIHDNCNVTLGFCSHDRVTNYKAFKCRHNQEMKSEDSEQCRTREETKHRARIAHSCNQKCRLARTAARSAAYLFGATGLQNAGTWSCPLRFVFSGRKLRRPSRVSAMTVLYYNCGLKSETALT